MAFVIQNLRSISKCISIAKHVSKAVQCQSILPAMFQYQHSMRNLSSDLNYEMIKVSTGGDGNKVGIVTLHRPKVLNALCVQLVTELIMAVKDMEKDDNINVIVMTGSDKAFAAGADIKEMVTKNDFPSVYSSKFLENWEDIYNCKKPLIAAVNGYALGGGCELALMADIILAGEKALFGQPEISIGTIPGGGGTQRLTKSIGKSNSMHMNLTGEPINAQKAVEWGLATSVHPVDKLMDAALDVANKIARHSPIIVRICKDSVKNANEMSLRDGVRTEKQLFYATFGTNDRKEGMTAFTEKRKPNWKGN